jgi:hypothetical protein
MRTRLPGWIKISSGCGKNSGNVLVSRFCSTDRCVAFRHITFEKGMLSLNILPLQLFCYPALLKKMSLCSRITFYGRSDLGFNDRFMHCHLGPSVRAANVAPWFLQKRLNK